jgi:hypothetical protein
MTLKTRDDFVKETVLGIIKWERLLRTLPDDTDEQLAYYAAKLRECIQYMNDRADMANFFDLPAMAAGARAKAEEMSTHCAMSEACLEVGGGIEPGVVAGLRARGGK